MLSGVGFVPRVTWALLKPDPEMVICEPMSGETYAPEIARACAGIAVTELNSRATTVAPISLPIAELFRNLLIIALPHFTILTIHILYEKCVNKVVLSY